MMTADAHNNGTGARFSFLLIGAGRGGTSLLAGLLGAHPEIDMGFELGGVDCLLGLGLDQPASRVRDDLVTARGSAFRDLCVATAGASDAPLWGNKITTEHLYGLEDHNLANPGERNVLDDFFSGPMRGIKVIFILRDGRTCVRSKVARTSQSVAHACVRWSYSVRVMRYLQRHHPDHLVVRYEDLLQQPEPVLRQICAFLGVDYSGAMLSGTQSRTLPDEYRQKGLDRSKLDLAGVPVQCYQLLLQELRDTGYIGALTFWYRRLRHSGWNFPLLLVVALLGLLCWFG